MYIWSPSVQVYAQKGKIPPKTTIPKTAVQDTLRNGGIENKSERIEEKKPIEQKIRHSSQLEVDGLIVDETITKVGRDFYEIFHNKWEPPMFVKNFTILIKEFPTRGNGALVQIQVNEEIIFEQQLQPRYDIIEELAGYGVAIAAEYLENNRLQQQLDADGKRSIERF
ncbi:CsgE family curli-type amyloid fiber assembly protein [uncultured Pontibacter sp.]|uniref:CsgE family curli-type amyloid fiber assembly protein n=1 Tax=uncultured Pontibacter sp. TaxID=453356 RepID=UPI00262F8715|nr:CsgE family curli-type amyloid fiber assembly protein [uncultured Pontibacter sp.]